MFVQFCFKRRSQKVSVADSTFYSKIDDTDSQNDYLALSPCVDEIQSSGLNQKLKKKSHRPLEALAVISPIHIK